MTLGDDEAETLDGAAVRCRAAAAELVSGGARRVWRAGMPERWGYRTDWRGPLLTRAMLPPRGSIRSRTTSTWCAPSVSERSARAAHRAVAATARARRLRRCSRPAGGTDERRSWRSRRAPRTAARSAGRRDRSPSSPMALARDGVQRVLVGSAGGRAAGDEVVDGARTGSARYSNLIGRTDLPTLAGVLVQLPRARLERLGRDASGAALGVPVTAMFGPTDEQRDASRSAAAGARAPVVLTHASGAGRACCASVRSITAACAGIERRRRSPSRRREAARDGDPRAGGVSRSRRHAHRRRRLSRSASSGSSCSPGPSTPSARSTAPASASCWSRTSRASRAGSSTRRSSIRSTRSWRTCSRPAARASTRITIVRTIRTARSRGYARVCDCRKPARGLVDRAVRELGLDPRALVRRRRPLARRGAGARGRRARRPGPHRLRRSPRKSGRRTGSAPMRSSTIWSRRSAGSCRDWMPARTCNLKSADQSEI